MLRGGLRREVYQESRQGTAVILYNAKVEDIGGNNLLEVLHELYTPISSKIKTKSVAGWTQERGVPGE